MTLKHLQSRSRFSLRLAALLRRGDFWYLVAVVLAVALLLWLGVGWAAYLVGHAEWVRNMAQNLGPFAPLAYIGLFALQILLAPVPGQFFAVMSGFLFGIFWGTLYSVLGLALGAGIAMSVARYWGRPLLERFWDGETIERWERKLRMRSPLTWGLLFVFPVPDLVFYVAGISHVPLGQLLIAVIAGRSIGLIFANLIGNLSAVLPPEWVVLQWAILSGVALIVYRYQRRLRLFVLIGIRRWRQFTRQR